MPSTRQLRPSGVINERRSPGTQHGASPGSEIIRALGPATLQATGMGRKVRCFPPTQRPAERGPFSPKASDLTANNNAGYFLRSLPQSAPRGASKQGQHHKLTKICSLCKYSLDCWFSSRLSVACACCTERSPRGPLSAHSWALPTLQIPGESLKNLLPWGLRGRAGLSTLGEKTSAGGRVGGEGEGWGEGRRGETGQPQGLRPHQNASGSKNTMADCRRSTLGSDSLLHTY